MKVAAHRHTLGVSNRTRCTCLRVLFIKIPTAKEPHRHARAGRAVDFLALHSIEDGLAGVLRGPHGSVTGGNLFPAIPGDVTNFADESFPAFRVGLFAAVLSKKVFLRVL